MLCSSHTQAADDELSMKVGDIITIEEKEDEDWWRGELHGKVGVFPSNFVEEIQGSAPAGAHAAAPSSDEVDLSSLQDT